MLKIIAARSERPCRLLRKGWIIKGAQDDGLIGNKSAGKKFASLPAQITIAYDGPADATKPKLFVLAIGINDYAGDVPKLYQSVADAQAFAAEMQKAAAPLYSGFKPFLALDADAAKANLEKTVAPRRRDRRPKNSKTPATASSRRPSSMPCIMATRMATAISRSRSSPSTSKSFCRSSLKIRGRAQGCEAAAMHRARKRRNSARRGRISP
jgi:hypothetical protein